MMRGEQFVTNWINNMSKREMIKIRTLLHDSDYVNSSDALLPKEAIELMEYLIELKIGDE